MSQRDPATRTVTASEARQQWSALLNTVSRREARVIVEKSGVPVAAIISAEDLDYLARMERQREEDWKLIEEIGARNADKDPEEVERDVAAAIEEVRAEQRAEAAARAKA
jgi:prevent-host-death family protein